MSNDKEIRESQQKEMQSKLWNSDIATMTTKEIQELIQNMFYQLLLIEVSSFQFGIKSDDSGTQVSFIIAGECFRDADNLTLGEKMDYLEQINEDLEE